MAFLNSCRQNRGQYLDSTMTVSFQILSSLSFVKNHLSFDGIIYDAESIFKSPTKESNTKPHSLSPYLVHMTHSRCRDPTSLPQRRVHWIAQFRVNKGGAGGGASDASDPSPGPWFPHSLAIPSAPCFILFQKESWDHV